MSDPLQLLDLAGSHLNEEERDIQRTVRELLADCARPHIGD